MKLFTSLSTLLLASSSALARPLDERTLEERQTGVVLTQPIPGTVYPRLEVRQMKDTRPNQYTLLVVALNRWMSQPQSSQTSYFGVASAHGVPRDNYNNVQQCQYCNGTDGYGVHDSILFPTWHRVYVSHFEQQFLNVVKQVANEYPASQKNTMVAAANQMRWPYYDSAAKPVSGRPAFPLLMSDVTVTVNGPTGKVTLTNPLFRYDFADPSGLYYGPFTTWKRTYRYPNTDAVNAASNTPTCVSGIGKLRQGWADQFYALFTNCNDYHHFSNDRAGSGTTACSTNIEDIHNTIHTAIGGGGSQTVSGGHMTYLPLSSFDPAFWLHHANIDRIFAMWQAIHPSTYVDSQVNPTASWAIAQGATVDATTPLKPFFKSNGVFWESNDVRNHRVLGYTYPEFADSDGSASEITKYVNNLYGPNANAVAGSSKRDFVGGLVGGVGDEIKETANTVLNSPFAANNGSTFQYAANIYTPRYLLNGSYSVYLFNGNPGSESDTSSWITDDSLIGMMGVLSKPDMVDNPLIASGSIPLTRTLQSIVNGTIPGEGLPDLTEALVVPYLTKQLQWRVRGPQGQNVDPGTIEGFVVSVFASSASPHTEDELPTMSTFINLLDVTKQQSGGANNTQQASPPVQSIPALPSGAPSYASF